MGSEADTYSAKNCWSTSLPGGEYEVFLSFRGPDTRPSFTDFLYTYLTDSGVRTFRDDDELPKGKVIGDELLKAISESSICIPIFSKNYASSKWCLIELAKMVECNRSTGQLILPVFYDIEPSDVRHQSGSYEKAFLEHQNSFSETTVKEWKDAMRVVGELKGWVVEINRQQGKLARMIAQRVLSELNKKYMVITDNLVMIDHHLNAVMSLLNLDSDDSWIVGIHGMGGIGKTTIAMCIYNKILKSFQCCSFLSNVREKAQQQNGLLSLQKQLLTDTLTLCPDIADVHSGIDVIKKRFRKKKVLIILDDVDDKSQFDWLVGNCDWFGPGSRIIITTRDEDVLNAVTVNATYLPPCMDPVQSLQLFSMHAFRRKSPPKESETIAEEAAATAAGLPLALEVIGSSLFGKKLSIWKDTLKKLKRIPHDQVQGKLRLSYDRLSYEQKQIFLDIACLFIGMDKTYAFYMWDDYGYYPEKELHVLCLRSLVQIENDNVLRMHNQLRDLGRDIVRQESFNNPGMRSRLWDQKEALDILEGQTGTEKVGVLCLEKNGKTLENYRFTKLSNLRYLQVDGATLVGNFKHHLLRLRWLRWTYCPPQFKATNFQMKTLVILDLSNSDCITESWKGWDQIKMANRLKVLNISSTKIRKLPDQIWLLEKLEVIDASCCYSLAGNISSFIGGLSSLRRLSFYRTKIQSLPASICNLPCLQNLDLGQCDDLQALPKLPSSLEILNVTSFKSRNLLAAPTLANLVNLQELRFSWCTKKFEDIPRNIEKLCKLQVLMLSYTNIRTLPKEISALTELKILTIKSCPDLQCIMGLPLSLVELYLENCTSVEILSDLSKLKILVKLMLRSCPKLTKIQGLGNLVSLTSLVIYFCVKLEEVRGLGNLESLESLVISSCNKIAELDFLEDPSSPESSKMREYKHHENKPDRCNLHKLKKIQVLGCMNLNNIQGLDRLVSLEYLSLMFCRSIVRLPNLSNLKMLKQLVLRGCEGLLEIDGLEALKGRLEEFDIALCTSLDQVSPYSDY